MSAVLKRRGPKAPDSGGAKVYFVKVHNPTLLSGYLVLLGADQRDRDGRPGAVINWVLRCGEG